MLSFWAPSRADADWFHVGPASAFPNLVSQPLLCKGDTTPGCKVFHIPKDNPSDGTEVPIDDVGVDLKDQVLVFQFRGKFHAIDHSCPHSSYPLSDGILFDVEDFGVVLSAGIQCPKHNWSFDLFTGMGDRGNYRLPIWEVQLRDGNATASDGNVKEVWVRRKPRIG
ncbi:hypothetical protein NKR19_g3792 [Coniochaeta hoffmannii]|uniref:Rieske domain-containing protein n=1 Tax=Coniochaeta hoffmannii TaxID=91930 RepID=A0AA38S6J1_9PEZI|nr:hypothetical protein NKR19_g3792 [Coniochaeta hoffmannii]